MSRIKACDLCIKLKYGVPLAVKAESAERAEKLRLIRTGFSSAALELVMDNTRDKQQNLADVVLRVLARGFCAVSLFDKRVSADIASFGDGFSFAVFAGLGEDAPAIRIKAENGRFMRADMDLADSDIVIRFKDVSGIMPVLMGKTSVATAFAQHRILIWGNINQSVALVRIIDITETYLLPKLMIKNAMLKVPKKQVPSVFIYIMMLFFSAQKPQREHKPIDAAKDESAIAVVEEIPAGVAEESAIEVADEIPAEVAEETAIEVADEIPIDIADEIPATLPDSEPGPLKKLQFLIMQTFKPKVKDINHAEAESDEPYEVAEKSAIEATEETAIEVADEIPIDIADEIPATLPDSESGPLKKLQFLIMQTFKPKVKDLDPAEAESDEPYEVAEESAIEVADEIPIDIADEIPAPLPDSEPGPLKKLQFLIMQTFKPKVKDINHAEAESDEPYEVAEKSAIEATEETAIEVADEIPIDIADEIPATLPDSEPGPLKKLQFWIMQTFKPKVKDINHAEAESDEPYEIAEESNLDISESEKEPEVAK